VRSVAPEFGRHLIPAASSAWRATLDGASGGGVVTYAVDGQQRIAFAVGTNSPIWPVEKKTAKIVVFGR
jgi:hypothetical protein